PLSRADPAASTAGAWRAPGSGGGSGRMFGGPSPPCSHRPRLARARDPSYSFPSSPSRAMLHRGMGLVTVRVIPRAGRVSVGLDDRGIVVRVRAAPEALGAPGSAVALHRGTRSRAKVFEVTGLGQPEAEMRLRATEGDSLPP